MIVNELDELLERLSTFQKRRFCVAMSGHRNVLPSAVEAVKQGTWEALECLRSKSYVLCVATMMVEEFSVRTLEKLGIRDMFLSVRGTNFKTAISKRELIEKCLADAGATVEEAVMIGDSLDDLDAAESIGMDFVAASYGYGLPKELCEERGITYVEEPIGLCDVL